MKLNKSFFALFILALVFSSCLVLADDIQPHLKPLVPDYDETGRPLPPGVPRIVDTNGKTLGILRHFTTMAYQKEALKLVIQEANKVASEFKLPEKLPITESNLVEYHIPPFAFNYPHRSVGFVTTKNYCYYISVADRFSSIADTHEQEKCWSYFDKGYVLPISRIDTNSAYQMATQWLSAVRMDVAGLNRDCRLSVTVDDAYIHAPAGKFVPIYWVSWIPKNGEGVCAAGIRLFTPTKTLLDLRVDDPQYILREPLVFTNMGALFPGVAPIHTNYPAKSPQVIGPIPP
jgi:hypothetical protein